MNTKLYKINNSNNEELNKISKIFINNLTTEPQYKKFSKDKNMIKKLIKIQIKEFLKNKKESIEIYSLNNKIQSTIIIINTKNKKNIKSIFSNKKTLKEFLKIIKVFGILKTIEIISHTIQSNNIIKKLVYKSDYIIYNLIVDEKYIGQNQASILLNQVLKRYDDEKKIVSLNTHNPNNIHIYQHFGFKLINIQTNNRTKQYQMIRKPQIKKIRIVENNLK